MGVFDQVSSFLSCHADQFTDHGRRRFVRHEHLPEREIMTGITHGDACFAYFNKILASPAGS